MPFPGYESPRAALGASEARLHWPLAPAGLWLLKLAVRPGRVGRQVNKAFPLPGALTRC